MKSYCARSTRIARIVSAVLAGAASLAPALAAAADTSGLEEVLVTATRHGETDLQTTPIAVTAVDEKTLSAMVGRDVSAVTAYVPNFSAARLAAFNAAAFAIRGVGLTDIIVYLDSPVAVNVDDFVMPSIQTQLLDTFDVERVEVLRGPQGTLFGKNTTGGLVNVTTRKPVLGQDSIQLQGLYGSFNTYQLQGAFNYSPSDAVAIRGAVSYNNSDGYYKNGATYGPTISFDGLPPESTWNDLSGRGRGGTVGGTDIVNGRVKVLVKPTDTLDLLFQYEFVNDKSDAVPSFNGTPKEPGCEPFGDPADGGCTFLWNSLGLTQPKGDPIDHMATTERNNNLIYTKRGQEVSVNGWYLNADWDLGFATAHGVFGYRKQDSSLPNTYTGTVPVNGAGVEMSLFDATREDQRDTYQYEVRLAGNNEGPVDWVVGGFYQENNATFCVSQVLGFLEMTGAPPIFNTGDITPMVLCNQQDATSWAGFGDVTWKATDKLSIGGGFRYTYEDKKWIGRNQLFVPAITYNVDTDSAQIWSDFNRPLGLAKFHNPNWVGNAPCHDGATPGTLEGVCKDSKNWSEPTYRATVSYQLNDDYMTYFKFDHGFKSGGYNDQTGTSGFFVAPFLKPYDPEYADSYELGLKSTLMDNRLRLNTALFYVNYNDAQRSLVAGTCVLLAGGDAPCGPNGELGHVFEETRFFNAAKMHVQGVEVEATMLVTDGLVVNANVSYNDGKYDKFTSDTNGDGVNDVDLSGLPITRMPKWKWGLNPTYSFSALGGSVSLGANLYYESEQTSYYFPGDIHKFDSTLDAKTILDANVTYTAPDDKWFARLYGNNLLDERYRIGSQVVATLWTHEQYGPPINWGLQMGMNFGGH